MEPPPPLPPIEQQFKPARRSRKRPAIAAILIIIMIGVAGSYFFVLPKMEIVGTPVPDAGPSPTAIVDTWAWGCNVSVRNSGLLAGNATVEVTFSYSNGTMNKSFTGSNYVSVGGDKTSTCRVFVHLPWKDAIISLRLQNMAWTAKMAG